MSIVGRGEGMALNHVACNYPELIGINQRTLDWIFVFFLFLQDRVYFYAQDFLYGFFKSGMSRR